MPSANKLDGARYRGRRCAETAKQAARLMPSKTDYVRIECNQRVPASSPGAPTVARSSTYGRLAEIPFRRSHVKGFSISIEADRMAPARTRSAPSSHWRDGRAVRIPRLSKIDDASMCFTAVAPSARSNHGIGALSPAACSRSGRPGNARRPGDPRCRGGTEPGATARAWIRDRSR